MYLLQNVEYLQCHVLTEQEVGFFYCLHALIGIYLLYLKSHPPNCFLCSRDHKNVYRLVLIMGVRARKIFTPFPGQKYIQFAKPV